MIESNASRGEPVHVRRFHKRMAVTTERTIQIVHAMNRILVGVSGGRPAALVAAGRTKQQSRTSQWKALLIDRLGCAIYRSLFPRFSLDIWISVRPRKTKLEQTNSQGG